ncbi:MAG TPA: crosslink repair DNA glycosylase YcaQ family protein, partial [Solirubrobacterales bacterium]
VPPFLLGDRLVARVDLKSDRQAGVLRVQSAFAEPNVDTAHVAEEQAEELRLLSEWLELGDVSVARKGDLAAPLRRALAP